MRQRRLRTALWLRASRRPLARRQQPHSDDCSSSGGLPDHDVAGLALREPLTSPLCRRVPPTLALVGPERRRLGGAPRRQQRSIHVVGRGTRPAAAGLGVPGAGGWCGHVACWRCISGERSMRTVVGGERGPRARRQQHASRMHCMRGAAGRVLARGPQAAPACLQAIARCSHAALCRRRRSP